MDCKCQAPGCPKTARYVLGFRVRPAGKPRHESSFIEGAGACFVCDEHAIRDPDAFFTARMKEKIELSFLKAGCGMPDFSDSQVVHTELEAGDYPGIAA